MLSSAALFAGNAVYDYKFGKKTTAVIRQFESGKPSSVIDDVLNQTLLVIAICTGIAFVFEELALRLQSIEDVQAQYMVQFSLNVFIMLRRKTPCFSYGDIRRSETKFLLKG